MSHTRPQQTASELNPDRWWEDDNLVTFADMIHAGMRAKGIPSRNQLAQLSARLGYGRGGKGIDRTVFDNLIKGRRREPQEHTLIFLSEVLGGPLQRWRRAAPSGDVIATWKPPPEANSPFGTQKLRYAQTELMRAAHEQSVKVYCDAYLRGQQELIARLGKAGWDTSSIEPFVVEPDPIDVGRIPKKLHLYDSTDDSESAAI